MWCHESIKFEILCYNNIYIKRKKCTTNNRYIFHTELLCKELRVLKVFDMFYVAIWKFYYKLMHKDLPEYFSTMKATLPTVCRRHEIRARAGLCSILLLYVTHLPNVLFDFALSIY